MFEIIEIMEENHKLMTSAVELNKKLRAATQDIKKEMSPEAYASSFCSVYFDIGRQTGKSEWIKNNNTDRDLIIVSTVKRGGSLYPNVKADVLSLKQVLNKDKLKEYLNIYFDDSRLLNADAVTEAYKKLTKERLSQTFIHLG